MTDDDSNHTAMAFEAEIEYRTLLSDVMTLGQSRSDRTGTGTLSLFGEQLRFPLWRHFPLLTGKRLHFKSIAVELLWMLSGSTNISDLHEHGVTIWDEWADANGDLGPIYGYQWRNPIDQIQILEAGLRSDPMSRRHILSAWRPEDLPTMALPPCHVLCQFYVGVDFQGNPATLSCHLYQRSADIFLGLPFNIASYALLTCMLAETQGLQPKELIISLGDAHLYDNHQEQAREYLRRRPIIPSPKLRLQRHSPPPAIRLPEYPNPIIGRPSILQYTLADIELLDYHPYPAIPAPVAV